jgi:predicted DNA-binding protein (MmcQ/YjbR family)
MTYDELLAYCLGKPGAWPDQPWDDTVVAKVHDKIFAFLDSGDDDGVVRVGVKSGSDREEADEWLLRYPDSVRVMRYVGRSGWNTLDVGRDIPDDEIGEAIDESYVRVVAKIPKKHRPPRAG